MNTYSYNGPVMEGDCYHAFRWKASTMAPSEEKAKNNLMYRFKKENGLFMGTRLRLPGKLTLIE